MKKVRLALFAALVVAAAFLAAVSSITFDGWVVWPIRAAMFVAATFSVSVIALLLATFSRTKGSDLWDTGYFQYMRAFWQKNWGDYTVPLQISVCRAAWLSVVTLLPWILIVAIWGYLIYFFAAGIILGFEVISPFWSEKPDSTVAGNLIATMFLKVLLMGVMSALLYITSLSDSFKWELPVFRRTVLWAYLIFCGVIGVMIFIAVPIKYAGLIAYLIAVGWGIGGLLGISLIVTAVFLLIKKGIPRLEKFIVTETVPGAILSARTKGWKEKVCPLIIQTIPREDR